MINATAGAVGEWLYPNGTLVSRAIEESAVDFVRFSYTHQVTLGGQVYDFKPSLGVYTCQVPNHS